MKFLFAIYNPTIMTGGAIGSYNLVKYLIKKGHQVIVVSTEQYGDINTTIFKSNNSLLPFIIKDYKNYLLKVLNLEKDVDYIYASDLYGGLAIALLNKNEKNHTKTILHFKDYWPISPTHSIYDDNYLVLNKSNFLKFDNDYIKKIKFYIKSKYIKKMSKFLTNIDYPLFMSKHQQDLICDKINFKKFFVIHDPAPEHFQNITVNDRKEAIKKYKVLKKDFIVSFIGSFSKAKGSDLLKSIILAMKNNNKIKFVLCGYTGIDDIEKFVKINNLNNILFLGTLKPEEIKYAYLISDLVLLTSKWPEPYGLNLAESLPLGIPILATNRGGPKDIIISNKNGYLLSDNPKEWVEKIMLLNKNKIKYKELSRNAKKTKEFLNNDSFYAKFMKIIK